MHDVVQLLGVGAAEAARCQPHNLFEANYYINLYYPRNPRISPAPTRRRHLPPVLRGPATWRSLLLPTARLPHTAELPLATTAACADIRHERSAGCRG